MSSHETEDVQTAHMCNISRMRMNVLIFVVLVSTSLMMMLANESNISMVRPENTKFLSLYVKQLKGKQPIRSGCANIYGSSPKTHPTTIAIVLCTDSEMTTADLGTASNLHQELLNIFVNFLNKLLIIRNIQS